MPATDQYWRDLPTMHQLFAWSALALLGATVLMMWKDESREYLVYQRKAEELRVAQLEESLAAVRNSDYEAELKALQEERAAAEAEVRQNESRIAELQSELQDLQGRAELLARQTKGLNAERDKARADYDIAVRDNVPSDQLLSKKQIFDSFVERAVASALELEQTQQAARDRQSELDSIKSSLTAVQSRISKAQFRENQLQDQLQNLRPDNWLAAAKRSLKSLPIINGFNPIYQIQYDWAQDLEEQLGMTRVSRLDRCRSCHVNISEFGAGNVLTYPPDQYEQPYCSHPNPALYLTATSPHPRDKFACTICHGGDGSGTSFQNAEHTPNDPVQAHHWEKDFHWHSNHFWEHPMSPQRFLESGCIRCHHNVTELGVNAEFGASAPKVYEGFRLITEYGCFGCHEINGYDGTTPIGPDLRLEPNSPEELAKLLEDPNAVPGKLRKVGPSLRHIAAKTTPEFVASWTREPKAFRPTTKMPQFFDLTNQHDGLGEVLQPVELAGIAAYLQAKSEPIELLKPQEGYVPDAERGKIAFERRGCLACHSHNSEEFAGIKQEFGPELSRVHEKILPGPDGFNWLYTWIKEPTRHHPRTKMPDLKLHPEGEGESYVDPAADITAFLLAGGAAEFTPPTITQVYLGLKVKATPDGNGVSVDEVLVGSPAERTAPITLRAGDVIRKIGEITLSTPDDLLSFEKSLQPGAEVTLSVVRSGRTESVKIVASSPLADLTRFYLRKSYSQSTLDRILEAQRFIVPAEAYAAEGGARATVKTDEVELVADSADEVVSEAVWQERQLRYIGRKTISRYGCYACHDIPGFEDGRPIGAGLNDWGRKDTSKLAFEHITEFLHHHGEPDGSSTMARAEKAVRSKQKGLTASDADLAAAFFVDSIEHHGRPGFVWQKLRDPRSYDYRKTETKGWDERLRMPKFPFNEQQIEAIATFILGLVADPPPPAYQYRPTGPQGDLIEGQRLLTKYNCTGCHMLQPGSVDLAIDPESLTAWDIPDIDRPAVEKLWKLRPIRESQTGKQTANGTPVLNFLAHLQQADEDFGEYSYLTWDTQRLPGDTLLAPNSTIAVEADQIVAKHPPVGGEWTEWLIPRLVGNAPGVTNLNTAWQAAAPTLYKEGVKVQTPWLFQFLKNPEPIRYTTVLRMPRFNMDDEEAQTLANYFAAVDNTPYPYQRIEPREAAVQELKSTLYSAHYPSSEVDYLTASWRTLNLAGKCVNCHAVGGNVVTGDDPTKVTKAPNLNRVEERLTPGWVDVWLYEPHWITPYTAMPVNFPSSGTGTKDLFDGNHVRQVEAVTDALFNYRNLLEKLGPTLYVPSDAAPATEDAAQPGDN